VRCSVIKAGGERCRGTATGGAAYCYSHDPDRAEERSRNARKAGRAGGNGRPSGLSETAEAKSWIRALVARLLKGEVSRDVATAAFMGLGTLARYIDLEMRLIEREQLIERMEAIERSLEDRPANGRGGGYAGF
jgi:hypothetical protein